MLSIAASQRVLQQCGTVPVALFGRIDADHWQIPMGLDGMIAIHRLQQRKHVCLILFGDRILQERKKHLFIGMHARWKPQGRA